MSKRTFPYGPSAPITIVLLTLNGASTLPEVLEKIANQHTSHKIHTLAIDSGSKDGTLDLLDSYGVEVHKITPKEFGHGKTRQLACELAQDPFLVYLVQDAIPKDNLWLDKLLENFMNPNVAAVCSRVLPPPDTNPLRKREVKADLQGRAYRIETRISDFLEYNMLSPDQFREFCLLHDISAAYRRELLLKHPFPDVPFGEDSLVARKLLEAGCTIVFEHLSIVFHAHSYRLIPTYRRNYIDGWFNNAYLGRRSVPTITQGLKSVCNLVLEDWRYMHKEKLPLLERLRWILYSPIIHMTEQLGQYRGGRD